MWWGIRRVKQIASIWQAAARYLGLDYEQHRFRMPTISGTMRGLRVAVDIYRQGSGKNSQTFTRYIVAYPSPGFDFRLSRQTGLSRIGKLFGAQDIAVGERSFDESFVVKTDDEPGLQAWLGASRLSMLVRSAAAYPSLVVTDTKVRIQKSGLETSRERLISTVRRVVDTAHSLSDRRAPKSPVLERRAGGELAEMAALIKDLATKSESLDEAILEVDTLATAGDRDTAAERIKELERHLPDDPDLAGWKERLRRPKAAPRQRPGEGPTAEELSQELFAGNALSFESMHIFDDRYRGSTVHWSGPVKSTGRIGPDSDIGNEGADRLVVSVATISHDLYGNTEIDAVIGLPAGTVPNLERGDPVAFTGTLVRVDPLVRNVFVADARLR